MFRLIKSSRPPLPYLAVNSSTASCAALGDKGHGACRRVQQRNAGRCQAVGLPKCGLQQAMQRADDIANHRFRGVVNAAAFALGGVVLRQKGLVKMNDRIAPLALAVELVQDARRISHRQHLGNIIHAPGQLIGHVHRAKYNGTGRAGRRWCAGCYQKPRGG